MRPAREFVLERVWDPLDDIVFGLIALSGAYWVGRVWGRRSSKT
jgi:hypothetical protein